MRAPVYRHVEAQSTIGGVSLNGFVALLGLAFGAIQLLSLLTSLAVIAGAYLALRLMGRGKPPLYWQHLAIWHLRRIRGGRLSAAARARIPEFPFGPYHLRDRGVGGGNGGGRTQGRTSDPWAVASRSSTAA